MRKGQAAMEFLMTYGWAILVVLAAIGALAYFGVLSPSRFLPSACQMPSGIGCIDYKVTASQFQFTLRNNLGADLNVFNMTLTGDAPEGTTAIGDCVVSNYRLTTCKWIDNADADAAIETVYIGTEAGDDGGGDSEDCGAAANTETAKNGQTIYTVTCTHVIGSTWSGSTSSDVDLVWKKTDESLTHGGTGKLTLKVES